MSGALRVETEVLPPRLKAAVDQVDMCCNLLKDHPDGDRYIDVLRECRQMLLVGHRICEEMQEAIRIGTFGVVMALVKEYRGR
jgi:hypothetical protein